MDQGHPSVARLDEPALRQTEELALEGAALGEVVVCVDADRAVPPGVWDRRVDGAEALGKGVDRAHPVHGGDVPPSPKVVRDICGDEGPVLEIDAHARPRLGLELARHARGPVDDPHRHHRRETCDEHYEHEQRRFPRLSGEVARRPSDSAHRLLTRPEDGDLLREAVPVEPHADDGVLLDVRLRRRAFRRVGRR